MLSAAPVRSAATASRVSSRQRLEQVREERVVAVRRLDEDLRLLRGRAERASSSRIAAAARGGSHRQVAREAEALPLEAAGHESQQDRGRAGERHDAKPLRVGGGDQLRAGVGHRRRAGLRQEPERPGPRAAARGARPRRRRGCARPARRSPRAAIGPGWPQAERKRRALFAFSTTKSRMPRTRSSTGAGSTASGAPSSARVTGMRYSAAGGRHGTGAPSLRSMPASAMSGRPTSAVGSSPRMLARRDMPRASDLALPAQSNAGSRSR